MTRWKLATAELRFLVIRRDDANHTTEGVLVIGHGIPERRNEIEELTTRQATDVTVLPICYRCIADRLYLPVDAELLPQVSDTELRAMLPSPSAAIFVWHPSAGLIQFQPEHIPSAADLLGTPQLSDIRWDQAQITETLNDRIRSMSPTTGHDLQDIIHQGQDDIGQDADLIDDAPRSPDEISRPKLHDAIRRLKRWLARGISGTHDQPEARGVNKTHKANSSSSWIQRWMARIRDGMFVNAGGASRKPQNAVTNLSSQRENELKRLLNLLDKDPDKGLRYALPFGGNSSRGSATPSGRLNERIPDFNMRGIGGSGPADVWNVPWEYQAKLIQRYRDLAQRELRLGNHRRAAYIYATLLNDLHSAATALEAGELFHDAAILHDKHLQNWMKAAECYRKGGFWEEALAIYRLRQRWIDAGELLQKLNQPDEARVMFLNEIRICEKLRDFLKAGELADQRLNDVGYAAALYADGWNHTERPVQCFRALMELHGRQGQHVMARRDLQRLAGGSNMSVHQLENAVKICSEIAINYPDSTVRDIARQQTWKHASTILSGSYVEQQTVALTAIRSLSKTDELLHADSRRFAFSARQMREREARKEKQIVSVEKVFQRSNKVAQILLKGSVQLKASSLAAGTQWQTAVFNAGYCFLLAANEHGGAVARFQIPKDFQSESIIGKGVAFRSGAETSFEHSNLRTNGIVPKRVFLQKFPGTSSWNQSAIEHLSENHDYVDVLKPQCNLLLDFLQLPTGIIWALFLDQKGQLIVEAIGANGLVRQSMGMDFGGVSDTDNQFSHLHHDGTRLYVLTGTRVWRIDPVDLEYADHKGERTIRPLLVAELQETPRSVTSSPPNSTPRLACSFLNGAQAVWPLTGNTCKFASDLSAPTLISTANGLFVAACSSNRRIECYRLSAGRVEVVAEFVRPDKYDALLNLFPGHAPNEFLLLQTSGTLEYFQIPVR